MDPVESVSYPPIQNPSPSGAVVLKKTPKNHPLIIVLLLLLIGAVGAAAYFYGQSQKPIVSPSPTPTSGAEASAKATPSPSPSGADSPSEASAKDGALAEAPPGSIRFTSNKLGISFLYQEKNGAETFSAKEIGNKVYVYSSNMAPTKGQYVEVLEKESSESLIEVLNRLIMAGYSTTDCEIKPNSPAKVGDPSFQSATIGVKMAGDFDMEVASQKYENCPKPYTALGGMAYFVADPAHPTKFAFFSIGQYGINGDATRMWQDTLQFTN